MLQLTTLARGDPRTSAIDSPSQSAEPIAGDDCRPKCRRRFARRKTLAIAAQRRLGATTASVQAFRSDLSQPGEAGLDLVHQSGVPIIFRPKSRFIPLAARSVGERPRWRRGGQLPATTDGRATGAQSGSERSILARRLLLFPSTAPALKPFLLPGNMRILMLTNTYPPIVSGVARSVVAFAEEYRRRGHEVRIIAPEPDDETLTDEPNVVRVPAIQHFNGSEFPLPVPSPGLVSAAVDEFQPDVIHAHHPFFMGNTAVRMARSRSVPLVFTHHTMWDQYTHYTGAESTAAARFIGGLGGRLCEHVRCRDCPESERGRHAPRAGRGNADGDHSHGG